MIKTFLDIVLADPVHLVLGSSGVLGALVLLLKWWHSRPKVYALYIAESLDTSTQSNIAVVIKFELENHGKENTSIKPSVQFHCLTHRRKLENHCFVMKERDRTLLSLTPKIVTLEATVPTAYVFSHFRVFTFTFSSGCPVKVRILNASGQSAGALKFTMLSWLFQMFGLTPHIKG
jgi:hypothetical protein